MIRTSLHNTLIFCASDIITETEEKSKWFFLFFLLFYQHCTGFNFTTSLFKCQILCYTRFVTGGGL